MTDENVFLSVIRVWASMAWADDVLAPAEEKAMRKLIDSAELADNEREQALGFLVEKVPLDTENIQGLSEGVREGIYRSAYRLAKVDLVVADEERTMLVRLREGLGLNGDSCKRIEASVDG